MTRAYEEIIEFIAAGTTPCRVISYRPSAETQDRVEELIRREKTSELTRRQIRLDHYLQLEP